MPQARGSSAGVWAQSGVCVSRNMGSLSISGHPYTAPLSQTESSAQGSQFILREGFHPRDFITGRYSPRRVSFQGQMVSTLGRLKGFSLQWPCRARAAAASQIQAA